MKHLRQQGILIVGSGNIVHNLRLAKLRGDPKPLDWALEFDAWVKARLLGRDFNALVSDATKSTVGKLSIPSPDHWYPFLSILGAVEPQDPLRFEYEGVENASISMRSLSFGMPE